MITESDKYLIGMIKAQMEALKSDVDDIKEDIGAIKKNNDEMAKKWDSWESRLGGALVILGGIGWVLLTFSSYIISFIQKKLGL